MFSCMPFLTPLLISNSNNTKQALGIIIPFSLGRIFSYTIISIIAYMSSFWLKKVLDDNSLFAIILGISTISMGAYLFYKSFTSPVSCGHTTSLIKKPKFNKIGFFTIGATMSVNPCAPIMALIGVAVNSSNIFNGFKYTK